MSSYYQSEDTRRLGEVGEDAPVLWALFQKYYGQVFENSVLTAREKSLIALSVAATIQCPYCIDVFTRSSLENGSNLEQMTEALHVASVIRAGATLAHGIQMKKVTERLSM